MFRAIAIASAVLVVPALHALAQPKGSPPAPRSAGAEVVLGQTGTMYDGDNARLRLPPEPNSWYGDASAGYPPSRVSVAGSRSATGSGDNGASRPAAKAAGER
ncbi:MAG TPA: hypothetical protein VMS01_16320 [Stellaceae bacterium]|nr:hypothetical protein [Stellaceae bacterium]